MRLLSFGSNSLGQLALNHTEDVSTPTDIDLPSTIIEDNIILSSGGNHTLLLYQSSSCTSYKSQLYAVGDNSYHQCGIEREINNLHFVPQSTNFTTFQHVPPPIELLSWRLISTGWECSHAVSSAKDSAVYACGLGRKGELGLGALDNAPRFMRIPDFPPVRDTIVKQITSGVAHTVVLLSDGTLYGWGGGRKGQLGSPLLPEVRMPRRIVLPVDCDYYPAKAACGRTFTAVISMDGKLTVIGDDKYKVVSDAPKDPLKGWKDIAAGWGTVYVLMSDGSIVAWGRNTHGQLPPKDLPPIKAMAVGSEHVIAIGMDGSVYAWGWGEHGNCGTLLEKDGQCVREVREIKTNKTIDQPNVACRDETVYVAAGCATSWIAHGRKWK